MNVVVSEFINAASFISIAIDEANSTSNKTTSEEVSTKVPCDDSNCGEDNL